MEPITATDDARPSRKQTFGGEVVHVVNNIHDLPHRDLDEERNALGLANGEDAMSAVIPQPIEDASRRDAPDLVHTGQLNGAALSKVLNLAEAAALVRCSRAHLSNVANGKVHGIPRLPTVRIGRRVLFRRESLELWLQQVESMEPARHPR